MISLIHKAVLAGRWSLEMRRQLVLAQAQVMLIVGLPLLVWQLAVRHDLSIWSLAQLLSYALLMGVYLGRHRLSGWPSLPVWLAPLLLSLPALHWVAALDAGRDALSAALVLSSSLVLVALADGVLLAVCAALLSTLLLYGSTLASAAVPVEVQLYGAGIVLVLLTCAASLRNVVQQLQVQLQQARVQVNRYEQTLSHYRNQSVTSLRHVEASVEQRSQQLQVRNRQLHEANLNLEAFNYMVSHDMRASLRVMDGFAKLLMEDLGKGNVMAARQDMERIQSSIRHMHGMVVELLKLSGVANADLKRHPVDLSSIAREVLRDLQMVDGGRVVDVLIEDGVLAQAEPSLVREVLQNLLGNAWKFTAGRAVARIQFGVTEVAEGRAYYVRDNGAGFDMNRVDEVFLPFRRLHSQQEFEGSGVGLAAVKRIIERHGGRVWASGTPGQGARLFFTLGEAKIEASYAREMTGGC